MNFKKLNPVSVTIHFDNHEGKIFDVLIEIPSGWKFKKGNFAGNDKLFDANGVLRKEFEYRVGYSMTYEYQY